ncbi:cysteine--1-D-myo-inosityl 2-amino-2-deoxy-alpha-D-glucopyranoside ligase [Microbacterium sp. STN6]|uniref:cysteine--1-D-myo-inosityl 2-amino-2-deoxy-alpha-D-glucopyranoside ligase n=1 Tax=Microbacterium sp. STN6 TaxID=2995588 RepID=UPI002260E7A6|nr:cysteine--1-D-myo-inosityl 2-amino-2-deoxy-alpha-D-glucopyranoside ligase [Microbacterium sp. STN6]MCX7521569.1 cysteine--1-D-myo-inosityl 2-amino-2-deoxy-alpha-D-glucopyranoside ligase [Microbacterium sp. STN6]
MRAWPAPRIPNVAGCSTTPRLYDTATQGMLTAEPGGTARLYVCGITPYDATHIGHANTYLAFDTLQRVWRDAGYRVHYAQNITDIDDPLLERATRDGVHWRDLADEQIELFRQDMASLGIIPPDDYVAVTEVIAEIAEACCILLDKGLAYRVPTADAVGDDLYFDNRAAADASPWQLGDESNLDTDTMLALFGERGGDPERPGKRNPLDPLLWRAARDGEPSWPSRVGEGRPGWHIECSVIALKHLGHDFTVQGGGSDLAFPHHEMSAGHAAALSGQPLARVYSHAGMIAYRGEKMSKSLGNLVLVSALREAGVDAAAIRLALLSHHYRDDWEWTDAQLADAVARLQRWRAAVARPVSGAEPVGADPAYAAPAGTEPATAAVAELRAALADDLDTPRAIAAIDRAIETGVDDTELLVDAVDALLGIRLA